MEEGRSIKLRVERGTGRGGREESNQTMALRELDTTRTSKRGE